MTRAPLRSAETCKTTEDSQSTISERKQKDHIIYCLLTRRRWCQCWTLHKLIQGYHCPWWRCPGWRQTCRTKSFPQTDNIKWVWFWSDITRFFPPIRLCTYIREANGLLSFRVWQKLLVLLSIRIVASADWILEWIPEQGMQEAPGWVLVSLQTATYIPECLSTVSGQESNRSQEHKHKEKNGRNVRLLSYIDHYWWERILSSIDWSETGWALAKQMGLLQPRSQPGSCEWHECQKLTDPPLGSSSLAPLLDHESSRWEWGSSLSDWVALLRLWGNGSVFWRRGTWGCEYLCEKRDKRWNHTQKK